MSTLSEGRRFPVLLSSVAFVKSNYLVITVSSSITFFEETPRSTF